MRAGILHNKIEKDKRKRKKDKVITLSSDSESDKKKGRKNSSSNKQTHHRTVSVRKKIEESTNTGPNVVFNPLTKTFERNINTIKRYTETEVEMNTVDLPSADQLIDDLCDEVAQVKIYS